MATERSVDGSAAGPMELLVIQGTPFCNLACKYCYLSNKDDTERFPHDLIPPLIARLAESRLLGERLTILWHAGEPLVLPAAYYSEAIQRFGTSIGGCKVTHSIQSNATLLSKNHCAVFREFSVKLGVSIDGPKHLHDAKRTSRSGRGSFDATIRGIRLAQAENLPLSLIAVITRESLDHADEMFDFFVQLGIPRIGFNVEEIEGYNRRSSMSRVEVSLLKNFFRQFYRLNIAAGRPLSIREFEHISRSIIAGGRIRSTLNTPFSILSVDLHGNFSTFSPEMLGARAGHYVSFEFGNILRDPILDALKRPNYQEVSRDIAEGVRLCEDTCEYFGVCGGGAPSNKFSENQSFASTTTCACLFSKITVADVVLSELETQLG